MPDDRPHIILIHCHDLGQYTGCYGADIETPNVDALADDGARFENHFTTAPQCSPSRGSMMTGNYPNTHGLIGLAHGAWELDDAQRTLPTYLNERGYDTHLFGLQHVSNRPERLGFGTIHADQTLSPGTAPIVHQTRRARSVADEVATFLDERALDDPVFASIGFFEVHRMEKEDTFGFEDAIYDADDPAAIDLPSFLPDRPGIRDDIAAMRGMVYAVDDAVGTIIEALDAAGIVEDTLVIFTTEHGIAFPRAKGCCHDAGIEGVLIARYPERFGAGVVREELVSNVDLLPTILDVVDEADDDTPAVDGRSLLSLLTDEADTDEYRPRDAVFAEMTWHDTYNPVRAIRTRTHKYIRSFWCLPETYLTRDVMMSSAGREVLEECYSSYRPYEQLYDLEADPLERTNVAGDSEYEDVRDRLRDRLLDWMAETGDPLLDGPVPPADYDEIVPDRLRSR